MAESTLRGRWGIVLIAAGTLGLLAAGAAWSLLPVEYEAFALLRVQRTPPAVLATGQVDEKEFGIFRRTQGELIKSWAVLNGTLREPSVNQLSMVREHDDDQTTWLGEQLTISYPNDTEIMRIAMRGTNPEDVVEIVDKVVEVYLQEIVYRDKQRRLETLEHLRRAFQRQTATYQTQLSALANLERIHQTSGSEAAQLQKQLATRDLEEFVRQRAQIAGEIRQTKVEIALAKAREEMLKDVRTGDSVAARAVAAGEPLSLALLLRKQEILEAQFEQTDLKIRQQTKIVQSLDSFSEQVATKQEEIEALRRIKNNLKSELDRAEVERLAPDRIIQVDKAVLADGDGDARQRARWFALAAGGGLGLVAVGIALRLPRGRSS